MDKANLSYRRRVNAAYFPLALATLTLYIWVGGPVETDVQYYDATLHVEDSAGSRLFTASSQVTTGHWLSLYSSERGSIACRGPDAHQVIEDLVAQVRSGMREHAPVRTGMLDR